LRVEPLLERRASETCVRCGEKHTRLVGISVYRTADCLDLQRVAASSDEQLRHLDKAFLARPGDFEGRARNRGGVDGELGERFRDRTDGYELGTHLWNVGDLTLRAPLHELLDELVELGGS
jgi:hypothetical protein